MNSLIGDIFRLFTLFIIIYFPRVLWQEQLDEARLRTAFRIHLDSRRILIWTIPTFFINRELTMLEFQRRVSTRSDGRNQSLYLERVKFLAILGSNLDEFFMVRVSGLIKQVDAGVIEVPPDGLTPAEQLAAVRKVAWQLMSEAREILQVELMPQLKKAGIYLLNYLELNERQKAVADQYFSDMVFPVLTPLAFDPGHPFPHISNLSLNLAVVIRDNEGQERFARVKIPDTLPRLVPLRRSAGGLRKDGTPPKIIILSGWIKLIAANLGQALFQGMDILETHPFRVTRDADLTIQELEAEDLLESMEQSVRQRRFGAVVRVTVNSSMPSRIRQILVENLEIEHQEIYSLDGPLGLSDLMTLHRLERSDLKDPPLRQAIPSAIRNALPDSDIF